MFQGRAVTCDFQLVGLNFARDEVSISVACTISISLVYMYFPILIESRIVKANFLFKPFKYYIIIFNSWLRLLFNFAVNAEKKNGTKVVFVIKNLLHVKQEKKKD